MATRNLKLIREIGHTRSFKVQDLLCTAAMKTDHFQQNRHIVLWEKSSQKGGLGRHVLPPLLFPASDDETLFCCCLFIYFPTKKTHQPLQSEVIIAVESLDKLFSLSTRRRVNGDDHTATATVSRESRREPKHEGKTKITPHNNNCHHHHCRRHHQGGKRRRRGPR